MVWRQNKYGLPRPGVIPNLECYSASEMSWKRGDSGFDICFVHAVGGGKVTQSSGALRCNVELYVQASSLS